LVKYESIIEHVIFYLRSVLALETEAAVAVCLARKTLAIQFLRMDGATMLVERWQQASGGRQQIVESRRMTGGSKQWIADSRQWIADSRQ
jgi:hypothetical protein